jgi:hypothetical protein
LAKACCGKYKKTGKNCSSCPLLEETSVKEEKKKLKKKDKKKEKMKAKKADKKKEKKKKKK